MFEFLLENAGTLLVMLVLCLSVAWIIRGMIREKRSGKNACGGCSLGCSLGGKKAGAPCAVSQEALEAYLSSESYKRAAERIQKKNAKAS